MCEIEPLDACCIVRREAGVGGGRYSHDVPTLRLLGWRRSEGQRTLEGSKTGARAN